MLTYVRDPSIQRLTINALDEQIRPKLFMQIIYLFIVSYRMLHIMIHIKIVDNCKWIWDFLCLYVN